MYNVAGMLTEIKNDFKITNDKSGLLQTAFILSYMVFAPFFGYLGDRYNRKVIMSSGVFLWCLTTFVGSYMKVMLRGIPKESFYNIQNKIISEIWMVSLISSSCWNRRSQLLHDCSNNN